MAGLQRSGEEIFDPFLVVGSFDVFFFDGDDFGDLVFIFRGDGIFGEIDHVFAGELLTGELARGELLIFVGSVIFVFELGGFDLDSKKLEISLLRVQAVGQLPVTIHGFDRLTSPDEAHNYGGDEGDVFDGKIIVL